MHRSGGGGGYRRRILIAVAAALIPIIAGCEAGADAPVLHWHQPSDGTSQQAGDITISNAFVLGPPIGSTLAKGQNAGLFLGLSNSGSPDRLIGVSAPGVARSVRLLRNQIPLNSQQVVLLTGPRPQVILENLLRPLAGGSVVKLTLMFAVAGRVTVKVPVMPRAQYYTTLSPPPSPRTAPTLPSPPTPTTPNASPNASASPSPSAS